MKYCALVTGSVDNTNSDPNNIIFTVIDTKLYVPVVTLSVKDYQKSKKQKLSKCFSKGLERSVYWNEYKKMRMNTRKISIDVSSNQTL